MRGSFGFAENFFVFAEYATVWLPGLNVDLDQIAVGLGGHFRISDESIWSAAWAKPSLILGAGPRQR